MYKCLECGFVFDEPETYRENVGECWGAPAYQDYDGCPMCKCEGFEKLTACELCGGEFLDDELISGVCEDCVSSYKNNFEICRKISFDETEENIKINAFLAAVLTEDEIDDILMSYIREHIPDIDCSGYIERDIEWFADKLKKEVNK